MRRLGSYWTTNDCPYSSILACKDMFVDAVAKSWRSLQCLEIDTSSPSNRRHGDCTPIELFKKRRTTEVEARISIGPVPRDAEWVVVRW